MNSLPKIYSRTLIMVLFLALLITAAQGAPKIVLGEIFTNTGCGPCVAANDHFDEMHSDVEDIFVMIRYHPWWPSSSDPFYMYNEDENADRTRYYDVSGVPTVAIDGSVTSWSGVTSTYIGSRASIDAGIDMNVYVIGTDSVRVVFTVEDDGPHGDAKVFAVVTEDTIHYSAPNGQTVFHQVMRDMLSGASGASVHLDPGEEYSYSFALEMDEDEWNISRCHVVGFIQESGSMGEVYQAAMVPLFAPLDYDYGAGPTGNLAELVMDEETADMGFEITNRGINTDVYHVWFDDSDIPGPWDVTIHSDVIGDFDSTGISIISFMNQEFSLRVSPNGHRDNIIIPVYVYSEHLETADTIVFALCTPNDYLLVNASGDPETGSFYKSLLDGLGLPYTYWNQAYNGVLGGFEDMGYQAVFWIAGENSDNPLDALPQATLLDYVNEMDGKLYISGCHIGDHSFSNFNLYYRTFGAMNSDAYDLSINANIVSENPVISDGYFVVEPHTCESMKPFASAEGLIHFEDELYGGVINDLTEEEEDDGGRVVYISFALRRATGGTEVNRFFSHCYDWLMTGDAIAEEAIKNMPANFEMITAYPSPFNGACSFKIHPPADGEFSVEIHDISGKLIDVVYDGNSDESTLNLKWQPESPVTSGVYLVVLRNANGIVETEKTIYMK